MLESCIDCIAPSDDKYTEFVYQVNNCSTKIRKTTPVVLKITV
jgi:hypothetical protein